MLKIKNIALWTVLLQLVVLVSFQDAHSSAGSESALTAYIRNVLKVETPEDFVLTLEMVERLNRMQQIDSTLNETVFESYFSPSSYENLRQIFLTFQRTEYNNVMAVGRAGAGKSHLLNQLVAMYSLGVIPLDLQIQMGFVDEDGNETDTYSVPRQEFIHNSDVVLINDVLLAQDNTPGGQAFQSQEKRVLSIMKDLFKAASEEFRATGRRSIFVLDEIATLDTSVVQALKKILDKSGFKNPQDTVERAHDLGFSILGMTTPDEYDHMVQGDEAVERRYYLVKLHEVSEQEAFEIVSKKIETVWKPLYSNPSVDPEAIWFFVRMRDLLFSPPLAMPASILSHMNDLMIEQSGQAVTLQDAKRFLIHRIGLTDLWFGGVDGKPPLYGLADRVKELVVGQEKEIERIANQITSWARFGFQEEPPVFFIGGPSGSGKDTLVEAFNQVLFGNPGDHLNLSLAGLDQKSFAAVIEGPSLGSHADTRKSILVQGLDLGRPACIRWNEARDMENAFFENFKVMVESGSIKPTGRDRRRRPFRFPMFFLGQWGEEHFEGVSDPEVIRQKIAQMTARDVHQFFLNGRGDGRGAVPQALLDRALRTGGVFFLPPLSKRDLLAVAQRQVKRQTVSLHERHQVEFDVRKEVLDEIVEAVLRSGMSARGIEASAQDLTQNAISKMINLATDHGETIESRGLGVLIEFDSRSRSLVLHRTAAKNGEKQTWKIPLHQLLRIEYSRCSDVLKFALESDRKRNPVSPDSKPFGAGI